MEAGDAQVTELESISRPLPHDQDAEVAALGCFALDASGNLDEALQLLNFPACFYNPSHETIFQAILQAAIDNTPVDPVTLCASLRKDGALEACGGQSYIHAVLTSCPTAVAFTHYAEIVRDHAIRRQLIRDASAVVESAFSPSEPLPDLIDAAGQAVGKASETLQPQLTTANRMADCIPAALEYLDALHRHDSEKVGLPTGYVDLDRIMLLRPGEMIVIASRPSIGKTALGLNIAENVALRGGKAVGIFSFEMTAEQLTLRTLTSQARVSQQDVTDGCISAARWQELMEAAATVRDAPIYLDDSPRLTVMDIRARAREMRRRHDIALCIVDYLQIVKPMRRRKEGTRENEVAEISSELKALAKELRIPILVLAQLKREAEGTPKISHLRESGAIEADADVIGLLDRERTEEEMETTEARLIIAKQRCGPTGVVKLIFFPQHTRFEGVSRIADEDVPDV